MCCRRYRHFAGQLMLLEQTLLRALQHTPSCRAALVTKAERENAFPVLCACRKGKMRPDTLVSQWSLLGSQSFQIGLAIGNGVIFFNLRTKLFTQVCNPPPHLKACSAKPLYFPAIALTSYSSPILCAATALPRRSLSLHCSPFLQLLIEATKEAGHAHQHH